MVTDVRLEERPSWTADLLRWYDKHKRDLPWRDTGNPYYVWVSEIMSQQTRIEAMRPYFESWIERFPTKEALAASTEDEVVHAWQGLGYYSRARNLRLGVQELMSRYGGEIPRDRKELESLKGVGPYTAGAILSMAFNQREEAVDGNVLRIYARLYAIGEDIMKTKAKKDITALVRATLPHDRPGDFNQALMDFGSAVCIPKNPRCESCPLEESCMARAQGRETELPVRITKKDQPAVQLVVGLIACDEGYIIDRRPDAGLLRGMWEFPTIEAGAETDADSKLDSPSKLKHGVKAAAAAKAETEVKAKRSSATAARELAVLTVDEERSLLAQLAQSIEGLGPVTWEAAPCTTIKHVFSHKKWLMTVYRGRAQSYDGAAIVKDDRRIVLPADFGDYAWAGPHGKLTAFVERKD